MTSSGSNGLRLPPSGSCDPRSGPGLLETYQDALLDEVCGARRAPLIRGRKAPFRCPACYRELGFRRRGSRSRRRVLLTRLGRMELTLARSRG